MPIRHPAFVQRINNSAHIVGYLQIFKKMLAAKHKRPLQNLKQRIRAYVNKKFSYEAIMPQLQTRVFGIDT